MSEDLITQFVTLAEDLGVEGLAKINPEHNENPIDITVKEDTDNKAEVAKTIAKSLGIKKEPKTTNFSQECEKCLKVFNDRGNLIKHIRRHDNPLRNSSIATMIKLPERDSDGLYQCFDCNKKVRCNSNFRRHVQKHHLKIDFKCDQCDFQHRDAPVISRHRKRHNKDVMI